MVVDDQERFYNGTPGSVLAICFHE